MSIRFIERGVLSQALAALRRERAAQQESVTNCDAHKVQRTEVMGNSCLCWRVSPCP